MRTLTLISVALGGFAWLGGCAAREAPEGWAAAEGIMPDRMLDPGAGERYALFRTLVQTADGERLVKLQYLGGELFGTPYDIEVVNREGRVLQRGQLVAGQEHTPYCVVEVRSESERLPEALRGKWLLAVGFWPTGAGPYPIVATAEEDEEEELAEEPNEAVAEEAAEDDDAFTVYFELPDWEGDGVELKYGSGNLGGDDCALHVRWIETGPCPFREGPAANLDSSEVRREEVERGLTQLLASESTDQLHLGLDVVLFHGVHSEGARGNVREALERLLRGHADPSVREKSLVALERLLGREGLPLVRRALEDESPDVRSCAALLVAWRRDETSIDALVAACPGLVGHYFASEVIGAFERWDDRRLVPGLIVFLEDTTQQCGRWLGGPFDFDETFDAHEAPNACAQRALKQLTGLDFPLDVRKGEALWREAGAKTP